MSGRRTLAPGPALVLVLVTEPPIAAV
eukprot:COSAG02_NODE_50297_length_321_cov_0.923423_1_plen_26_part_01